MALSPAGRLALIWLILCFSKGLIYVDLLQFSWRRGSQDSRGPRIQRVKDSRGQGFKGLFSKDFISAFNILSFSVISFFSVPYTFSISLESLNP